MVDLELLAYGDDASASPYVGLWHRRDLQGVPTNVRLSGMNGPVAGGV
jgi:hypothetical protein